jgi:hypothetical protein
MRLIKTASVAIVLGLAVAATTAPANAFFFHHKDSKTTFCTNNPICGFFKAVFHHGK